MPRILCSTGAFLGKTNNNDYRLLKEYAPRLECDGLELMMSSAWYTDIDNIAAAIKSYGLTIPVVHSQKSLGESMSGMKVDFSGGKYSEYIMTAEEDEAAFREGTYRFIKNLRLAEKVGAEKMVLHLWNGLVSDKNIQKNIERFGAWKGLADRAGISLLVENVICNNNSPLYNMKLVAEAYEDAGFVYDTKMSEFHGETMKLFEPEYEWIVREGRIKHLHLNDYGGGYMDWGNMKVLPFGQGHVDFDSFFGRLAEYGYSGDCTVEATAVDKDGKIDFAMLNECFNNIRNLFDTKRTYREN